MIVKSVLFTSTFDSYRMLNVVYFDSDNMSLDLSLLDGKELKRDSRSP